MNADATSEIVGLVRNLVTVVVTCSGGVLPAIQAQIVFTAVCVMFRV
jgi:hypothetical protein